MTLLLGALVVTLSSCTRIKEDRSDCPCILTLEFSQVPQRVKDQGIMVYVTDRDGNLVVDQTFTSEDYDKGSESVSVKVPKGDVQIAALGGWSAITSSANSMSVNLPSGNEADSLFLHTRKMACLGETALDRVDVHKQWCTLTLVIEGVSPGFDYDYALSGNWSGLALSDFSPIAGDFLCKARQIDYGILQVRIPRQGDSSLTLGLSQTETRGDGSTSNCSIPIGEMVSQTGYDWSKTDLEDLTITIDYSLQSGTFTVVGWTDGGRDDKVI